MSEADALVLERTLRMGEPGSALEQGRLLQEMESRLGISIEQLARRFDRSKNWVASRLALVDGRRMGKRCAFFQSTTMTSASRSSAWISSRRARLGKRGKSAISVLNLVSSTGGIWLMR